MRYRQTYGSLFLLAWAFLNVGAPSVYGQAPAVQAGFEHGQYVGRHEPLSITLDRPLDPSAGRLALFLGKEDVTALVEADGLTLRYTPEVVPLPPGETELVVFFVTPDGAWQEAGRFPLRVRVAGNLEQAAFDPGITLGNKGQLAHSQFPHPLEQVPRATYQDFSGQADLKAELQGPRWSAQAQANVLGASYQHEALRYGLLGEEAPRIDLSSYLVQVQRGALGLHAGHIAHGRHRHLIDHFGSRGLTAGLNLDARADLSVAVLNGSSIVGWSNPFGLNEPAHRVVSGTAGLELVGKRPGGLRLEATLLGGSVLPQTGFNQGGIPDAEKSRGAGLRVMGSTPGGRLRFEGGYAGSRYTNPFDPTLAQDAALVEVRDETRYAHFVEVSAALLHNVPLSPSLPLNLSATYRRERVDPLYRSVASYVRPDNLQHGVDLQAALGPASAQLSHVRSEDNLEGIPSILKTKTRQHLLNLGLPLGAFAPRAPAGLAVLLPTLSYSYHHTHQFGTDLPENGGFSPSHVPDQVSRIHNAGVSWQGSAWSFAYQFSAAVQDNRQEGRAAADFLNRTNSLALGITPAGFLDLGLDVNLDRAESKETEHVDYTRRLGVRVQVRPTTRLSLSGSATPTRAVDRLNLSRRVNTHATLEASYAFQLAGGLRWPVRGQVFVRYARQTLLLRDATFELFEESRTWTLNSGISLSLF